ncbi:MAG: aminotransferase class V-fold PLP-dependent enzyme [bacterium]|nr:aminotransferase class V-fold PLP-dependent enzyme [bacterium]
MDRIYLDQAATSFPKAEGVAAAMTDYIEHIGVNINRGGYNQAYRAAGLVYDARESLCSLFDFDKPSHVIFTQSITYAMNMILKGFLKEGDHVLVSSLEHNAVMRPLTQLQEERGISFTRIPCNAYGEIDLDEIEPLIRSNTRAVIMTHASNLTGVLHPIREIGALAHKKGLRFIVDTAQTAGVFPISMKEMQIDALAFTGHKTLLGPQGIGGFLMTDEMAAQTKALISGGTGSISDTEQVPDFLPDKFEAGTLNLPGIAGLQAGLSYISKQGAKQIRERERMLTNLFLTGILDIENIRIVGRKHVYDHTEGYQEEQDYAPIVSVQCRNIDESELAYRLDTQYGIMTRVGMHCAPHAHKALGTFPKGTLRFSFGFQNREEDIRRAVFALRKECGSK